MPLSHYSPSQLRELEQAVPPRIGENREAWLIRALAAASQVGGPPQPGTPSYTGLLPPIATQPYTGPPLQAMQQNGGSAGALGALGNILPAVAVPGAGAITAALGGGTLAALVGGAYGLSQAIGVQYPWETGPGEGMIAPWSRDIAKDESGRWVTRQTRPDLFANGGAPVSTAVATSGGQATIAVQGRLLGQQRGVVKTWDTGYTDAQGNYHPGWPFAMTSDADGKHKRIHTVTKDGVPVSWRPYRPIVLGKKMKQGMALRAVRKLQGIKDLAYKIEDLAGAGMKHSVKRSKKK